MYLVTGATGIIGRPLVETLLAQGAEVRAVTRDPDNAALRSARRIGRLASRQRRAKPKIHIDPQR